MSKLWQRNLPVPFFSQRENKYIWKRRARNITNNGEYYNGVFFAENSIIHEVSLAFGSCNITSLCMILHYFGITDDSPDIMMRKFYEMKITNPETGNKFENDFRHEEYHPEIEGDPRGPNRLGYGVLLKEFVLATYHIPPSYVIHKRQDEMDLNAVKRKIANGYPVWFSYGATTGGQSGHIAVIRGFTENDDIIINDPWGDVATPEGYLGDDGAGTYYSRAAPNANGQVPIDRDYGLGAGDNCVLAESEFAKVVRSGRKLNQALVIEYPHLWSFPFRVMAPDPQDANRTVERPLRFSEPAEGRSGMEDHETRRRRIDQMLGHEVTEKAGYPVSANSLWHDGIHISAGRPVYATGPGRLVAARIQGADKMAPDGDTNFVLVKHLVTVNNRNKEFYSHYMHMAPVDIRERIRKQLAAGNLETAQRERDWIDQLIEHIKPKRAMVYIKGADVDGLEGNLAPLTYRLIRNELSSTNERLQDRALIYLCPIKSGEVRSRLENIDYNEELAADLSWFYNAISNVNSYIHEDKEGKKYYAYYHKITGSGTQTAWEIRYVEKTSKIKPQHVNIPEFVYYRRILARLIKGEVVTFSEEDRDTQRITGNISKKSDREVFKTAVTANFPNIEFDFENKTTWPDLRTAAFGAIEKHYTDRISLGKRNNTLYSDIHPMIEELEDRLGVFGGELLAYPAYMLESPGQMFTIGDPWYKELLARYKKLLDTVGTAFLSFSVGGPGPTSSNHDRYIDQAVGSLNNRLLGSIRSNVDYHIEVTGNTRLGMPGRYGNRTNIIHWEIFSDDANIVPDISKTWNPNSRYFVSVTAPDQRDDYFKRSLVIKSLQDSNFLKETTYFSNNRTDHRNLTAYLNDSKGTGENIALQYAVVRHLHGHAKLSRRDWEDCFSGAARGSINIYFPRDEDFTNWLSYKWFDRKLADEIKPLSRGNFRTVTGVYAVFYHPVRFLEWLDRNKVALALSNE